MLRYFTTALGSNSRVRKSSGLRCSAAGAFYIGRKISGRRHFGRHSGAFQLRPIFPCIFFYTALVPPLVYISYNEIRLQPKTRRVVCRRKKKHKHWKPHKKSMVKIYRISSISVLCLLRFVTSQTKQPFLIARKIQNCCMTELLLQTISICHFWV